MQREWRKPPCQIYLDPAALLAVSRPLEKGKERERERVEVVEVEV